MCFACLLGSITAASGRFLSFRLPNRGGIVLSGLPGVCLFFGLSPPVPLAFFRSGDRTVAISYLLGSFSVYPPSTTADSVRLHWFRLSNRGYIIIRVAFVLS